MYEYRKGFTIVELLIVIVVIGVLAAVITISYTGITQKANIASIKSDLRQSGNLLSMYKVINNQYPDSINLVNNGQGLDSSSGVSYSYTKISDSEFCLTAKHEGLTNVGYFIDQDNNTPTLGFCPGDAPPLTMDNTAVSTVAGNGSQGFADGPVANAMFYLPRGLAVDDSGSIYVADTFNSRIRKITLDGEVSTLASSITRPNGIALDSLGNLYVSTNHSIIKVNKDGAVSAFAGSNYAGFADGIGTSAQFDMPTGLAVDSLDNIYVADTYNNRIRKITPSGVVSTIAGSGATGYSAPSGFADGSVDTAIFNKLSGVAVGSLDNIYVADTYNNRIRKIASGVVSTVAGDGTSGSIDGASTSARFDLPFSLVSDNTNNIYIADLNNNRIRKIASGVVSTLAGSTYGFTDGASVVAKFRSPYGIALDKSGNLYIADTYGNRIRKISPSVN